MNPLQANHPRTAAIAGTCVNRLWGTFLPGNRLDNQHGSYRVSQTTPSLSASRRDSYSGSQVKIGSTSGQAVEMLVHVLVRSCASKVLMHACCAAVCAALGWVAAARSCRWSGRWSSESPLSAFGAGAIKAGKPARPNRQRRHRQPFPAGQCRQLDPSTAGYRPRPSAHLEVRSGAPSPSGQGESV